MTYESPEERRQRAGIIEVPLPGKSAKKLNEGSHNGAERRHGNGATRGQIEGVDFRPEIEFSQSRAGPSRNRCRSRLHRPMYRFFRSL